MIRRVFGWTGVEVAVIGQGTWMIEEAGRRAVEALRLGLDLGMTHIDTAEMYGNGRAEELVGEAIRGRRDEVFLASKVLPSNASYEGTLRACERSLRRLGVDRLDLYMLHWPGSHPIRETMRAMEKLVAEGMTSFIGVSNFDVEDLRGAEATLRNEPLACDQVLYHLGDRGIERRLIPYCRERDIAVVGYSPFGHRGFRGDRQAALRFLASHEVFLIPKSSNPDHVRENAAALERELTREEYTAIDRDFPAPGRDVPLGMI